MAADTLAALLVATWARYAEGVDEDGDPIEVADRRRDALTGRARPQQAGPAGLRRDRDLCDDLVVDARFTAAHLAALGSMHLVGARRTFEQNVASLRAGRPSELSGSRT